jgi:hypothetical protein
MEEREKRKFDALATLWKGAWDNFHQRRIYEWKFSIAIWTAIAIFIASKIFKNVNIILDPNYLIAGGVLISFGHILWIRGIKKRNSCDRKIAIEYEEIMRNMIDFQFSEELKKELDEVRKSWGIWNHGMQVGLTILLSCAAVLVWSLN